MKERVEKLGRRILERTLDCLVLRELPHGLDASYDMRKRVRELRCIVDVGANLGQSALAFHRAWPTARIYSIEPFSETFRQLQAATTGMKRIVPVRCAFGAEPGTIRALRKHGSSNNSLVNISTAADEDTSEAVQVRTLDDFCADEGLQQIDFLKIDTEGYDLEVLKGAKQLLSAGRVGFIQVEAGMTPHNQKHVPFRVLQPFLEEYGYNLFGLYEQAPEWSGEARLRFCNAVFVSERLSHVHPMEITLKTIRRG